MNSSKFGPLILLIGLTATLWGVAGYSCPMKLQGNVDGGISIFNNTVTFSVDVTDVLEGPAPCAYSGLSVEADLDVINRTINFGGRKVEIYGEYQEWTGAHLLGCGIYVEQPGHYIKVIDSEPPQPDLIVEYNGPFRIEPEDFSCGNRVKIWVMVRNEGMGDAVGTFRTNLYFDGNLIGYHDRNGLAGGRTTRDTFGDFFMWAQELTWPRDGGYHTIKAIVDVNNDIEESNEANNELSGRFRARCPQLAPQVSVYPSSGSPGTKFSVQWEGFTPNSTLTSHLQKPDGTEFPTLRVNTDSQGKASHTINSIGFSSGTYTLWAIDNATGTRTVNTATFTITSPVTEEVGTKRIEIKTRPYLPIAKLTVNYEWIDKRGEENIYSISSIKIELIGFSGQYKSFIRDQQGRTLWEDSKRIPPGKPKTYTFTFEGASLTVRDSDKIGISLTGIDVITSIIKPLLKFANWYVRAVDKLIPFLPIELIYEITKPKEVKWWKESPIIVIKSVETQFHPESTETLAAPLLPDMHMAYLASPAELRVYDSEGRVTGLVNGEVKEEIPNSVYFDNTVMIHSPSDSYRHEVAGTMDGLYWLTVASVIRGDGNAFTAADIPISANATHQYTVDWNALAQGMKGVTVEIDKDGDGVFELTIQAENELRGEDIGTIPQLPVPLTIEQLIARLIPGNPSGVPEPDLMIGDQEILQAISFWINDEPVPGTGGQRIDDATMLRLIKLWISGQPIRSASAQGEPVQAGATQGLTVREIWLSPNLVAGMYTARFKVEGTGIASMKVEIFNLAGRRVFEREALGNTLEFHAIGKEGRPLANGAYLYVVTVRGFNGEAIRSEVRKLIILK